MDQLEDPGAQAVRHPGSLAADTEPVLGGETGPLPVESHGLRIQGAAQGRPRPGRGQDPGSGLVGYAAVVWGGVAAA